MNNKGFTLVELLVAISILAILTMLAIPTLRAFQSNNSDAKYINYKKSTNTSAKLYNDSYNDDLFGQSPFGCEKVYLEELETKKMLKDISIKDVSCLISTSKSFVVIRKYNDEYSYKTYLHCENSENVIQYDDISKEIDLCNNYNNPPEIKVITNNSLSNTSKDKSVIVTLLDEYGFTANQSFEYGWTTKTDVSELKDSDFTNTYNYNNSVIKTKGEKVELKSKSITVKEKKNGLIRLAIRPKHIQNIVNLSNTETLLIGPFRFDHKAPKCPTFSAIDSDNNQIKENERARTVTVKYNFENMEDDFSGFDVAVSSDGGTTFSEIHQDQTSNSYTAPTDGKIVVKVITKDFAGNKNDTCISPIYIKDNSAPTCPTVTAKAGKTTLTPGKWTQEPKVEFTFKFSKDTTAWDWYTNSSKGEFTYNNVRYKKWNQEKYNVSFNKQSISGQGKRKILLYVYDAAGNKSVACQYGDYNIDHCESTETEWNKWSSCTNAKNCGTGTQTRTGTLVSKLNNNITCGKKNAQKESQSCYTGKDCCGPLKITGDSKYQAVGPFKCECNKEAIYQNARLHFHIDGCIDGDISGYICYYNPNLSSSYRIRCDKFKAVYGQKHINYKKGGGGHACFASKTDWYYYRSTEQGYAYVCNQDNQCTSTHISTNG